MVCVPVVVGVEAERADAPVFRDYGRYRRVSVPEVLFNDVLLNDGLVGRCDPVVSMFKSGGLQKRSEKEFSKSSGASPSVFAP